ncbi:MAG: hypothetical protein AB8I08_40875 [Sandaracinaceae bacterium]
MEALARCDEPPPPLTGSAAAACWAMLAAAGPTPSYEAQLALQTRWNAVGQPTLAHPGVPEAIRLAILREYLPAQRDTDPRLLIEGLLLPDAPRDEEERPTHAWAAHAALEQAGFSPSAPISAGQEYQQGAGTYHVVRTAQFSVTVSDLGPWLDSEEAPSEALAALAAAGLEALDAVLLGRTVEGLPVYFFGERKPLPVSDLLFYWQD